MNLEILERLKKLEGQYFKNTNSQAGEWLHYKLEHIDEGKVTASILVRPDMLNPKGNIHGGMLAMICDELCGLAFFTTGQSDYYTTVNLTIDFLYGVSNGETIIAQSKVWRSGKRIANVECILYDKENRIVAHAKSNLVNTNKKTFELSL